jgi:hypothetical protein
MIKVRLKGGMGNQMFQYAFGLGQAARLNTTFKLDCSSLLDRAKGKDFVYRDYDLSIFNIEADFHPSLPVLRAIYKLKFSKVAKLAKTYAQGNLALEKEKHFHLDEQLIANPLDQTLYDGWWQSEHYFSNVKEDLRCAFSFKHPILPVSLPLYDRIRNTNSVCLNVRRTDFLTTPALNATNLDYFLSAAKLMAEKIENPHFFVFSDDTLWCRENIILDYPVEIVEHDVKGYKFGNYLQLMTSCKNFIIPNSSFAWWAVWLNVNPDKFVIAPQRWFNEGDYNIKDLVPNSWIRL